MTGLFSTEFVAALAGIIGSVLVALIPQLDSVKVPLIAVITVLLTAAIAVVGGEKFAAARATGQTQAERASVQPYKAPPPTVHS